MADFAVCVALKDEHHVVYKTASGMEYPFSITVDELSRKVVDRFNDWIARDKPYERLDLELLGQLLYQTLFPSGESRQGGGSPHTIRELFEADYTQFFKQSSDADRFRLTLELHEAAPRLARFPWEFLFVPPDPSAKDPKVERGFFLAGQKNKLILTRFVPREASNLVVKEGAPIRILVVLSHPPDLPNIDSDITRDVINGITRLADPNNVEVRFEDNITFNQLLDLLNKEPVPADATVPPGERVSFRPDILHFIGHGKPGSLAFMRSADDIQADKDKRDNDREPVSHTRWCDATEIQGLFSNYTPRLVFLHACESAAQEGSVASFTDLARALVYSQIPCVIAMQYVIKNRDAGMFANKFYDEIRKGVPVDEAVRAGRFALGQSQDKRQLFGDRRFGTPVVYFQLTSDQPLIKFPKLPEPLSLTSRPIATLETQGQDAAAQENRRCPRCCDDVIKDRCAHCGLRFKCLHKNPDDGTVCREPIAKPLTDRFCRECGAEIVQVAYDGPLLTRPEPASSPSTSPFDERAKVVAFPAGKV